MVRRLTQLSLCVAFCSLAVACASESGPASASQSSLRATVAYDAGGETGEHAIVGFRFEVSRVECTPGDGAPLGTTTSIVDFVQHTQDFSSIQLLGLVSDNSNHAFADLFITTEPGCYDIAVTALSAIEPAPNGVATTGCAVGRTPASVRVEGGQTFELPAPLVIQCAGEDNGAIDIPVITNTAPKSDPVPASAAISNYICGPTVLCVTATDEDNDPLSFVWSLAEGTQPEDIFSGPTHLDGYPVNQGMHSGKYRWLDCAEVVGDSFGDYGFVATVYDLRADGTTFESHLDLEAEETKDGSHDTETFTFTVDEFRDGLCVNNDGDVVTRETGTLPVAEGCEGLDLARFYCEPLNAEAYGFDLATSCPYDVFNPHGVFPMCEGVCTPGQEGCECRVDGERCDEGLVCFYRPGDCGETQIGVCLPEGTTDEPRVQGYVNDPVVCGCDGITYANIAAAYAAGVSVADIGACDDSGTGSDTETDTETTQDPTSTATTTTEDSTSTATTTTEDPTTTITTEDPTTTTI